MMETFLVPKFLTESGRPASDKSLHHQVKGEGMCDFLTSAGRNINWIKKGIAFCRESITNRT